MDIQMCTGGTRNDVSEKNFKYFNIQRDKGMCYMRDVRTITGSYKKKLENL